MTRVLTLVVLVALAACSRSTPAVASSESAAPAPAAPAQAAPAAQAAAKPVPAELPDVVARVNGQTISAGDLQQAVGELEARAGQGVPPDQRDRIVRGVLDQLIAYRLLAQESAARRIAVPDADVDARIAQIRSQFPSEQQFTQTLTQRKMTLEGLRTDIREGLQIDKMLDAEVAARAAVTPEQVSDFYAKNPAEFQQAERVHASHILIRVADGADAAAKDQARARAADVLQQVKAGGDFAALAKEHSQDPGSAPKGGDLGFFDRGQMVGPFEQAAFSVAPGLTSELVETQFGFHIVKVLEKQSARAIPLEEVRAQVEQYLQGQNRERETQAFIESLKSKGKVDILI
ncbi:MAG: peptidylprolyl isomerase [Acidobacteria bacterium]|nr:peptidylprolyl isomerase [Acidobacteriota bacterium]